MRVFVNAASIREGGPRVVLLKLMAGLLQEHPELQACIAAPDAICDELRALGQIKLLPVAVGQGPLSVARWYEFELPRAARRWSADVVFSVTNYLPLRRLSVPTLLLEQHAGHFSPVFDRLMREPNVAPGERLTWPLRRRWVNRSVEMATVLTVQTAALADAIAASTRVRRDRIRVIPHGPGWVEQCTEDALPPTRTRAPFRIGYVAKSGVQKNFITLFRAVKIMADRGIDVRLVLTLDPADAVARPVLQHAETIGIAHLIENNGELSGGAIAAIYDSLDVFVFPSLCESFGMPMVEAMARGLCVVVADTPENREIVLPAGQTFPPLESEALAEVLSRLWRDDAARNACARASLLRARDFSWREAARDTFRALTDAANSKPI